MVGVRLGQNVSLYCYHSPCDSDIVSWQFDYKDLPNNVKEYKIKSKGLSVITIRNTDLENLGQYRCEVDHEKYHLRYYDSSILILNSCSTAPYEVNYFQNICKYVPANI